MDIITTPLEGLLILEPRVFGDNRGYFFESYNRQAYVAAGITADFVQDNESMSAYGVIRGLHYQAGEFAQAKLVRCARGAVLDVAVDIRQDSPTYGQHMAVELTEENHRQLFIPRGFAHGFSVLSDVAIFQYKCDNYYAPQAEGGYDPLDPALGIDWQIPADCAIFSDKDRRHPRLKGINPQL